MLSVSHTICLIPSKPQATRISAQLSSGVVVAIPAASLGVGLGSAPRRKHRAAPASRAPGGLAGGGGSGLSKTTLSGTLLQPDVSKVQHSVALSEPPGSPTGSTGSGKGGGDWPGSSLSPGLSKSRSMSHVLDLVSTKCGSVQTDWHILAKHCMFAGSIGCFGWLV